MVERQADAAPLVGTSLRRVEDERFLTGQGSFTADRFRPGDLVCGFVRSTFANGRIRSVETATAAAMPGVLAVLTASDIAAAGARRLTCVHEVIGTDGRAAFDPGRPALADGVVRFVGDPIVLVVAETAAVLADAMEVVAVEIEALPSVTDLADAIRDGAPRIWDAADHNISFDWEDGDGAATAAAFDRADHVVRLELVNNRIAISPLEPRGMRVTHDPATGRTTLESATQGAHELRNYLADVVFGIERSTIRVVTPDVGGSFGMKIMCYAEHVALMVAARLLRRPVTWVATRSESFLSDNHGRDHVTTAELALRADGRFLALRCDTLANLGAYIGQTGAAIPTVVYATVFGGCYDFSAVHMRVRGVFTNQPCTDAYRGAGVPESLYLLERLVDVAARDLGLDRSDLRRRNFVRPEAMPYRMAIGRRIDVGNFAATLEASLAAADHAVFAGRRAASVRAGRRRGIGIAAHLHGTGGYAEHDRARVEVHGVGRVVVFSGAVQSGQGHETVFRQLTADRLGVPPGTVELRQGDSDDLESTAGSGGSSGMVIAANSLLGALERVIDDAREAAAEYLQVPAAGLGFAAGRFVATTSGASMALFDVARERERQRAATGPGCTGAARFAGEPRTFPYGTHVAEVEVDPETGLVQVLAYVAVDDIGVVVNPMIARGQLQGGVAQGIGQALFEHVRYDLATGQLLSGSFMDYALPRATMAARHMIWRNLPIPSTFNPQGMKGIGEVGAIAAPPAVINAVCDALDLRHLDMPATPARVFDALRGGRVRSS